MVATMDTTMGNETVPWMEDYLQLKLGTRRGHGKEVKKERSSVYTTDKPTVSQKVCRRDQCLDRMKDC